MSIFSASLKRVAITLVTITAIICLGLLYLNKNPIIFSVNKNYGDGIQIVADDAILTFSQNKFRITATKLEITVAKLNKVIFDEAILSLDPWILTGQFNAKLNQSELLPIIDKNIAEHNFILFNGEVQANFLLKSLTKLKVNLTSQEGWNDPKIANLPKIKLKTCDVSLIYKANNLAITNFNLQYDNGIITKLIGDFALSGDSLKSAKFNAEIESLPIDYLVGLWPKLLFPDIHQWVTSHVNSGMISHARGDFNFTEAELSAGKLAKDAINAEIEVVNGGVDYFEGYGPIKNINGLVRFDGNALYLDAGSAKIFKNGDIKDLKLMLDFDSLILSITADVKGPIRQFVSFMPQKILDKLQIYKLNFNEINGDISGKVDLSLPINNDFDLKKFKLNINANIRNVTFENFKIINIKNGTLELINEEDKISLKINDRKLLSFIISEYHDEEKKANDALNISLSFDIPHKINLNMLDLNAGKMKVDMSLEEDLWNANVDLSAAEIYLDPIGYTKAVSVPMAISCNGKFEKNIIASEDCHLSGHGFAGDMSFSYVMDDKPQLNFAIKNAQIDKNNFSFALNSNNNFSKYNITAKTFDISKLNLKYFSENQNASNFQFNFKIDQLYAKNNMVLPDFKGQIISNGTDPIDISLSSKSTTSNFTVSKALKNGSAIFALYAKPAADISKAFGVYNNIKNGEIWIDVATQKNGDIIDYKGKLKMVKFAFTNTSVFSKIIMGIFSPLNSPIAIAQTLQGGAVQASSFTADLEYRNGLLHMHNGVITGSTYSIKLNGTVDFNNDKINFEGIYVPSAYGINTLIASIPLIGKLISGGKKSAFLGANFSINGSFENPKTNFNPFSIFTPGFLRNFIP